MLNDISRVTRQAADSAARAANQVVDRYAYPNRQSTYPPSMPVGRRSGGQALAVTLLLALGALWLASRLARAHAFAGQRSTDSAGMAKPLQNWEAEGGATPPGA